MLLLRLLALRPGRAKALRHLRQLTGQRAQPVQRRLALDRLTRIGDEHFGARLLMRRHGFAKFTQPALDLIGDRVKLVAGIHVLADLGVLGCLTSPGLGGLGLDLATYAMVLEELARGWSTVAGLVAAQATAAHIIERFGEPARGSGCCPR